MLPVGLLIDFHKAAKAQLGKVSRKMQHTPSLYRVLTGVEGVLEPPFRQQLVVLSLLHNVPVIQHQNEIRVHNGA